MSSKGNEELSPFKSTLRSGLWPIYGHERKKLIPMLLIVCLIVFCYDILRNVKDAVVITAAGAEVIPFIKVWALLPGAILATCIFTSLSNRYSQERVFYIMVSSFLAFFALFAFVIYPFRHSLHANATADFLEGVLPLGLRGLISMLRHWSFSLFYVMAELWGSIIVTVLFWGFANEVTRIDEARRFFGVFCFGSNCCAILAGQIARFLPQEETIGVNVANEDWTTSLMILVTIVIFCGIVVMGIFRWMNCNVLNHSSFDEFHSTKKAFKAKGKLSMKESFSYLANSKYLVCIATIVFSYNLVINLVEVVWKDQLRRLYPSPAELYDFTSNLTSMIGVVSACMSLFMAYIINRFGWTRTALITPMILLITCIGFFSFLFYRNYVNESVLIMGASPLFIAVMFGAAQNCLSKAMKYSVFDGTKEMAFIPLSHECKLKGKAAIDGIGSRMGKSSGSLIHTGLLMVCGSLTASAPFVAAILLAVIVFWIFATRTLGQHFNALVSGKPLEEPRAEEQPLKEAVESIA